VRVWAGSAIAGRQHDENDCEDDDQDDGRYASDQSSTGASLPGLLKEDLDLIERCLIGGGVRCRHGVLPGISCGIELL
jgi:hypothetical protein